MNKILKLAVPALTLIPYAAQAQCPVCTAAVLVGLEGARRMGVDEAIVGVWAGGLFLALIFMVWNIMRSKGVKNPLWYLLPVVGPVAVLVTMWMLKIGFGVGTLFGVDKFLLGILVGAVVFFIATRWYFRLKKKNGGKSWFPFQKVVWPVSALLIASAVFAAIIYL